LQYCLQFLTARALGLHRTRYSIVYSIY